MRLPRVRFTVRRMMVAVAMVGMVLGIVQFVQRRDAFREKAAEHARLLQKSDPFGEVPEAEVYFSSIGTGKWFQIDRDGVVRSWCHGVAWATPSEEEAWVKGTAGLSDYELKGLDYQRRSTRAAMSYHEALKAKYERAARYPWLSVAPDPPAPK